MEPERSLAAELRRDPVTVHPSSSSRSIAEGVSFGTHPLDPALHLPDNVSEPQKGPDSDFYPRLKCTSLTRDILEAGTPKHSDVRASVP